jgi:hypothetical protein
VEEGMSVLKSVTGMFAIVLVLSISMAMPVRADEMDMDGCTHDPTIDGLRMCVVHASHQGHIDNAGVARALLAKLDAAAMAVAHQQPLQAVNILEAFVAQVDAQAGHHIHPEHAAHLRGHAEAVIAALGG